MQSIARTVVIPEIQATVGFTENCPQAVIDKFQAGVKDGSVLRTILEDVNPKTAEAIRALISKNRRNQ